MCLLILKSHNLAYPQQQTPEEINKWFVWFGGKKLFNFLRTIQNLSIMISFFDNSLDK